MIFFSRRPFGRERLGAPVKPPRGAYLSRVGTERRGKGCDSGAETQ
ncbi:MAG: hypothetical protein GY781_00485 [Gammaproteobacteria bacterium]|nr:hypothetical protein [Gammaproteobacteria bacterium]